MASVEFSGPFKIESKPLAFTVTAPAIAAKGASSQPAKSPAKTAVAATSRPAGSVPAASGTPRWVKWYRPIALGLLVLIVAVIVLRRKSES